MTQRLAALGLSLACLFAPIGQARAAEVDRSLPIDSPALGRPIDVAIYLPDAYVAEPARRFPVIYLLHGHGGDGAAWLDLGGLRSVADRMIADGRLPPSIIVMPSAQKGWYVDSAAPGGGRWQTAILDDLTDAIDRRYRTLTTREGRAVAGYSMGGYGALRFALLEPDRFAVAASLSGALFPDVKAAADFPAFQIAFFGAAFGATFDPRAFNAASPWRSLAGDGPAGDAPALYLAVGDRDIPILKAGNEAFRHALAAAGVPAEYHLVPGGHDWRLWATQLEPMLAFVGRNLKPRANVAQDVAPVQTAPVAPATSAAVAKAADALVGMEERSAATAAPAAAPLVRRP